MTTPDCPSRDAISKYLLGEMAERDGECLDRHVAGCEGCAAVVNELEGKDNALVGAIRGNLVGEYLAEPQFQRMMQAAAALVLDFAASKAGEPSAHENVEIPAGYLGQYELLGVIGRGGMGVVYKARHQRLDKIVALKVLTREHLRGPHAMQRFEREMRAVGRLDHENIVRAVDAGEADGLPYLVMDYVRGLSLRELVKIVGALGVADTCEAVRQIALALQYIHEQGMVHRDVKPSNVIVDQRGQVKLLDLGLSMLQEDSSDNAALTTTGAIMGTLDYMSPEQCEDTHHVDIRTDLYSLGCLMYELLAGHAPFVEPNFDTRGKKLIAHLQVPPKPIREIRNDVPPQVAHVLERLLAKRPEDRYATPADLVTALESIAAGSNLTALVAAAQGGVEAKRDTAILDQVTDRCLPSRAFRRRSTVVAVAASLIGVMALGILMMLQTGQGTLVVEIDDPTVEATVTTGGLSIQDMKSGRAYTVEPGQRRLPTGQYGVMVRDGAGLDVDTSEFTLRRNERVIVRISMRGRDIVASERGSGTPQDAPVEMDFEWIPGPREDALPGIVPRPAVLPGIKRWQVETRLPRSILWAYRTNSTVVWSPDERMIACGADTGVIRIYDAGSGALLRLFPGHNRHISSLAWSPDGLRLASSGIEDGVRVWSLNDASSHVFAHVSEPCGRIFARIAWKPDGTAIAGINRYGWVVVWDPLGKMLANWQTPLGWTVDWSPDGQWIVTGHESGAVRTWKPDGTPGKEFVGHVKRVSHVTWSPDGQQLASASEDGAIRLRKLETGEEATIELSHAIHCVVWSPDGRRLAAAGTEKVLVLNLDGNVQYQRNVHQVASVAWSRTSDRLLVGHTHGFFVFEPGKPNHLLQLSGRTSYYGHSLQWHPSGETLVSTCRIDSRTEDIPSRNDFQQRFWQRDGRQVNAQTANEHHPRIPVLSPDGTQLAQFVGDAIHFFDSNGLLTNKVPLPYQVASMAWSPYGDRLALLIPGETNHFVRIARLDGSIEQTVTESAQGSLIAWHPQGQFITTGGGARLQLWNIGETSGLDRELPCRTGATIAWSPDGKWLAVDEGDGMQLVGLDGSRGPKLGEVGLVAWNADGTRLATANYNQQIWIWTVDGERQLSMRGHRRNIRSLVWSPTRPEIISQDSFRTMVLFDVETGEPLWTAILMADGGYATFSPAGQLLDGDPVVLEEELVYVIETLDHGLKLFRHSEFIKRFAPRSSRVE